MKTVLYIEDNPEIRENMGEILTLANYKVLLAPDGLQGVAMAIAEQPDIIVCDIMMPELDGYGVLHLLQKHNETRHIPFIFLTAMAERSEMRRGMELGADDYLTKPFSGTDLLHAVEVRLHKAAFLRQELNGTELASETSGDTNGSLGLKEAFEKAQEVQHYEKKQKIFNEGQHAFRLYYVVQGKVRIFKTHGEGKELITGICQPGSFFGYSALLEGTAHCESAEALEPSEIASIPKETFEGLMQQNREVMRQVIRILAGNVLEKEEQLVGIAYNSLRRKVAGALLMLNKTYHPVTPGKAARLQISRDHLASMAGTAKESLIRTLGDFRAEGLITIEGREITILDEKKLQHLVN